MAVQLSKQLSAFKISGFCRDVMETTQRSVTSQKTEDLKTLLTWYRKAHRLIEQNAPQVPLPARRVLTASSIRHILIHVGLSNSIHKPTRYTFCIYLFYNLFATLHVSNDYSVHHQEFINLLYLQLCTSRHV